MYYTTFSEFVIYTSSSSFFCPLLKELPYALHRVHFVFETEIDCQDMHNLVLQSNLYCQNNFFPKVIRGHVLLNRPKNPSSNDVSSCKHKRKTYLGLLLQSKHTLMRKVTKQCNSFRRKDTGKLSV